MIDNEQNNETDIFNAFVDTEISRKLDSITAVYKYAVFGHRRTCSTLQTGNSLSRKQHVKLQYLISSVYAGRPAGTLETSVLVYWFF